MEHRPSSAKEYRGKQGIWWFITISLHRWTDTELSSLSWNYMQSNLSKDTIREIVKLYKEDGISKSRDSVIKELYKQNLINKVDLESLLKTEKDANYQQIKDARNNDISKLCNQLIQDNKVGFLEWIQKALLDTCFAKIYLEKKTAENPCSQLKFECFKKKHVELPLISPVSYHSLRKYILLCVPCLSLIGRYTAILPAHRWLVWFSRGPLSVCFHDFALPSF